jgi:hypothetical protein
VFIPCDAFRIGWKEICNEAEWYDAILRQQTDRTTAVPEEVYSDKVVEMFPPAKPSSPKTPARVERRSGDGTLSQQNHVLPMSEDGEKGVLCSLLLAPSEIVPICVQQLNSEAFYIPAHRIIYNLVLEFRDDNKPIDFVLLKQALADRGLLEEIGGPEYLSSLYNFVPAAENADHYIGIVREKWIARQLALACQRISTALCDRYEDNLAYV